MTEKLSKDDLLTTGFEELIKKDQSFWKKIIANFFMKRGAGAKVVKVKSDSVVIISIKRFELVIIKK